MNDKAIGVITGLEYSDHYIGDLMHCLYDRFHDMSDRATQLDQDLQMSSIESSYMSDIKDAVSSYCEFNDKITDKYIANLRDEVDGDPEKAPMAMIIPELEGYIGHTVSGAIMDMSQRINDSDRKTRELEIEMNKFQDDMNDQYHYYRESFSDGTREFPCCDTGAKCVNNNRELIAHAIDYTFSYFSSDARKHNDEFFKEDVSEYAFGDDLDYIKFMSPVIKSCGEPVDSEKIPTVTLPPKQPMETPYKEEPFFGTEKDGFEDVF